MGFTLGQVESLAPDQASLTAASKLAKAAKWLSLTHEGDLWWGECQGSGSNPYRTVTDSGIVGYKCTCPSHKFPCKHSLALMWISAQSPQDFSSGTAPEWVNDWLSRRRTAPAQPSDKPKQTANIAKARLAADQGAEDDPAVRAKKEASARKRQENTRAMVADGLDDLDQWISDQLSAGLLTFVGTAAERCRKISARLLDNKAGALSSRLDEMPSRLLALPVEERPDAAIAELGKLVLMAAAWRADPDEPQISRDVSTTENRDTVLANPDALRVRGRWEVVGEQIRNRRDGLVSHSTWFLNLNRDPEVPPCHPDVPSCHPDESQDPQNQKDKVTSDQVHGHHPEILTSVRMTTRTDGMTMGSVAQFALLLDYYPASAGRRESSYAIGTQYDATMVFYPGRVPLRAFILDQIPALTADPWPMSTSTDPLEQVLQYADAVPWQLETPLLLPPGRIVNAPDLWWRADSGAALPLSGLPNSLTPQVLGIPLTGAVGIWDGARLTLLSATTPLGKVSFS